MISAREINVPGRFKSYLVEWSRLQSLIHEKFDISLQEVNRFCCSWARHREVVEVASGDGSHSGFATETARRCHGSHFNSPGLFLQMMSKVSSSLKEWLYLSSDGEQVSKRPIRLVLGRR